MHPIQSGLVDNATMAMSDHLLDDRLPADSWKRLLTRGINISHDHPVRVIKGRSKFTTQRFGSRIAMRLEHGQNAVASSGFGGGQSGANFSRMMCVIIHEEETIALVLDLETSPGVFESAQRSDDLFERH